MQKIKLVESIANDAPLLLHHHMKIHFMSSPEDLAEDWNKTKYLFSNPQSYVTKRVLAHFKHCVIVHLRNTIKLNALKVLRWCTKYSQK